VHLGDGATRLVGSPGGAVTSDHATMSKSANRIRTNGAYVIKSAASRPRVIKASGSLNGRSAVVTPEIKQLVQAVWQHARS
jgi:hypothetical protein